MAKEEQTNDHDEAAPTRGRKSRRVGHTKIQAPLVPMIDVTFQLLLYFLLTTEFRMQEGQIAGTVPEEGSVGSESVVDIRPIRITIRRGSRLAGGAAYTVLSRGLRVPAATAGELYVRLMQERDQQGPEVPIVIEPAATVPWEFVTEAFNQAVRAKFQRVGFAPSG